MSSTDVSSSNDTENTISHAVYTYEYDELNRTVKTTLENLIDNTEKVVEENIYNPVNNVIYQKTEDGITRTIYDDYSRVVQEITSEDYKSADDSITSNEDSYSDKTVGTRYTYASNGNLAKEINRLDVVTNYTYYEKSSIVKTESFDNYVYNYNKDGLVTTVKYSGQLYATYEYDENSNNTKVVYGNGQIVNYDYDEEGNLTACRRNDEETPYITMSYSKTEDDITYMSSKTDYDCGRVTYYDKDGNTTSIQTTDGETVFTKSVSQSTDDAKEVYVNQTLLDYSLDTKYTENNVEYESGLRTMSVAKTETENSATTEVSFNSNNRLIEKSEYDDGKIVKKTTSTDEYDNNAFIETVEYDEQGRIITVETGVNDLEPRCFEYKDGRLVKDHNPGGSLGYSLEYEYDERGNIISTKKYGYSSTENGKLIYSRLDEDTTNSYNENEDLMQKSTVVDMSENILEETVEYDINGNPLKYFLYDYDLIKFEWTNGRQLKKMSVREDLDSENWIDIAEYTYDENGIRTSVKAEGKTTYFIYEGITLLGQYTYDGEQLENAIMFLYDENGEIQGAQYSTSSGSSGMYYYTKDVFGNVHTVRNSFGDNIAAYQYEAYGKNYYHFKSNNRFGDINPIRYRGYYQDSYFGGYYNISRYYNSGMGRFLNLDDPMIALQSKSDPDGMNLFAYCNNDPVNYVDPTGYWKKDAHYSWTLSWINYYRDRDYYIGFIGSYSIVIANNCRRLDIDYPSTYYATHPWEKNSKQWQYFHFNGNLNGTDSRIKYSNDMLNNAIKSWKVNKTRALLYLGYGLHAIQDIEAHGQIGRGTNIPAHGFTADNENYVWVDKAHKDLRRKRKGDRSRKTDTKIATYNYLRRFCLAIWRK